jgi:hypothetical protein
MYWEQADLYEETLDCGTMPIEEFIDCINNGEIPLFAPEGSSTGGWRSSGETFLETFQARMRCNNLGMWAIVFHEWVKELAKWIDHRQCLEIMAGAGWLAKALKQCDISITATDDFSWNTEQHAKIAPVFPISNYEASKAIININADILIVSWPPYDCNAIVKACEVWGTEKPIIYIGEDQGGCNATDAFFERFKLIKNHPDISMKSWNGIHDHVKIGYWQTIPHNNFQNTDNPQA